MKITFLLLIFCLLFFIIYVFYRAKTGIRVLMFHKVHPTFCDDLTINTNQLTQILTFLKQNQYQIIEIKDWLENKTLANKPVILTFDDAYMNQLTFAYPILQQFEAKATIFVPTALVGKTNEWDGGNEEIMSWQTLKNLDKTIFSLAYHSHQHLNYKKLDAKAIEKDLMAMQNAVKAQNIAFEPYFAYPYGGRPKDKGTYQSMKNAFQALGIKAAFRIGNRMNAFENEGLFNQQKTRSTNFSSFIKSMFLNVLKNNNLYELQRIDIRGSDDMKTIERKIKFGKWL